MNNWLNDAGKILYKQKQTKSKPTQWEEIIKIRADINEIETKKKQ